MESYLENIDTIALFAGLLGSVLFTFWLIKTATIGIRAVPLFLASFGSSVVVSSMAFGHLFENCYRAALRVVEGTFVFNFHFYSIILMGLVILSHGLYMLWQLRLITMGDPAAKKRFLLAAVVLSALTAPVFLLRPIGLLPTIACIISLSGLYFLVKPVREVILEPAK